VLVGIVNGEFVAGLNMSLSNVVCLSSMHACSDVFRGLVLSVGTTFVN